MNRRNFYSLFGSVALLSFAALPVALSAGTQAGKARLPSHAQNPDAVCASCHRQIFDSWERTPMAHASGPAAGGFIPADFTHAASGVHYRIYLDQGHVWLSHERPNAPPDRAIKGKQLLLFYLGSGRRGRTWLFQREG
jgi:hypothetical protein